MSESKELLRSYLRGLMALSGAKALTLFLPRSASGGANALWIHEGEDAPAPELADESRAELFLRDGSPRTEVSAEIVQAVASTSRDCRLFRVIIDHRRFPDAAGPRAVGGGWVQRRRHSDRDDRAQRLPAALIGLRFDAANESDGKLSLLGDISGGMTSALSFMLAVAGGLARRTLQTSAILDDPVTGLAARTEFQASLDRAFQRAHDRESPLSLLMLNPDDFSPVNERFGREGGDSVIQEIAERFANAHRSGDIVAKYGAVVFASLLEDTGHEEAATVARKVLKALRETRFLDGALELGFSIGLATFVPGHEQLRHPLALVRRADHALNLAKRDGGNRYVVFRGQDDAHARGLDRLSGIFTGNMAKDYRNMALLSDLVEVISESHDFDSLAERIVKKLYATFKPARVALLCDEGGEGSEPYRLIRHLEKESSETSPARSMKLGPAEQRLLAECRSKARALMVRWSHETGSVAAYAVPLVASRRSAGCLYMDGAPESLPIDAADLLFLEALGAQIAVALDRARLTEEDNKRREQESKNLLGEIAELRQALGRAQIVYRSREMEALIETARRVAPTDATVLLIGESGTGKDLIARTIHALSPRRHQHLVVVDCGAIPSTLIESEFFGHEKGAYTGAQHRRIGRLEEADKGTVLLDEIAELPLEVQTKLLRFVQERQLTPVGGSKARLVDVRIIAATNRDLAREVAAGRFRADLFYRLNVVRLDVPPLRERRDDILHLANYFVEKYSLLYRKGNLRLSPEGEERLLRYSWPGNVRELENRIMQAAILCERDELAPDDFQLSDDTGDLGFSAANGATEAHDPAAEEEIDPKGDDDGARATAIWPDGVASKESRDLLLKRLRAALAREIEAVLTTSSRLPPPMGRWLSEDLVLEASEASGGVAARAASMVGLPESTYRRRLNQTAAQHDAGLSPRYHSWQAVRDILALLVRAGEPDGVPLLELSESILLDEVLSQVKDDNRTGAALLGVAPLTFRQRSSKRRTANAGP
jgi:diguanylate cyclase (GGDEF)-like protein